MWTKNSQPFGKNVRNLRKGFFDSHSHTVVIALCVVVHWQSAKLSVSVSAIAYALTSLSEKF